MARQFAGEEQYRVVSSEGVVFGPYPRIGTARGVRTQKENSYRDTYVIERATVKWKYVE